MTSRAPPTHRDSLASATAPGPNRSAVFVHAGNVVVPADPTTIGTILGSCVAVCLWDRKLRIGGMNHYILPHGAGSAASDRFGNIAITSLIAQLKRLGASTAHMQAKVFGGAWGIGRNPSAATTNLGAKNVEMARVELAAARITIVAEDVHGARGRKLVFHTDEGTAFVRVL